MAAITPGLLDDVRRRLTHFDPDHVPITRQRLSTVVDLLEESDWLKQRAAELLATVADDFERPAADSVDDDIAF